MKDLRARFMAQDSGILSGLSMMVGIMALTFAIISGIVFAPPSVSPIAEVSEPTSVPVLTVAKVCAVATAIVSLIGLGISGFAYWLERVRFLPIMGIGLCSIALLWQYIVLGVIAGVTIVAVLFVLWMMVEGSSV